MQSTTAHLFEYGSFDRVVHACDKDTLPNKVVADESA